MNGKPVQDVLDFRFFSHEEEITLEIKKPSGEIWELEIEKDEDEDLGLGFATGLMDETKTCCNNCLFCFMEQLPPGLRPSLYVKDDDPRLSFLTGNYVTLTNMTAADIRRIAHYHLSPLHVSVHAADPALRQRLTGSISPLFDYLHALNGAGITLHFQIVLCRGINDGTYLSDTIHALAALQPGAASLSVVPAGLTKYREKLYPLAPFTQEEASRVITQVQGHQREYKKKLNTAFVFCADEWYLLAKRPLPPYRHYENFPQLENGVGMTALFEREFTKALPPNLRINKNIGIVTGTAAAAFMRRLTEPLYPAVKVLEVTNNFFGPLITVSGLLTGKDILAQLTPLSGFHCLFLPQNAFRHNSTQMLDGTELRDLARAFGLPVYIGSGNGGDFAKQLAIPPGLW
jgi:putative radical SAM enzyme (TIGR03279 family)